MLKDKICVVTGGTRGIGKAIVEEFLNEGATVIFFGSREETVAKALEEYKKKYDKVEGAWPNLMDGESIKAEIEQIVKKYGRIDVLANNAGVADDVSVYDYDAEKFDKIMNLNVKGVFNAIVATIPHMKEKGGGSIISTSSMVSKYGQTRGVGYPTSKFAVNGLTISLARELGPDGIRVNAVAPGITNTDMMKNVPKEMIEPLIQNIPLRRIGEPEDIAKAYAFLASDKASYISGTILNVDGAMLV
ncbi:3-oxoacyl-ACP reductase family protein [Aedoeadaptatus coxii]|uniref:SDR family NAD(P)-dependent oxidoreductase n=1 Tax=Aedoeadaptatus coxii TaxID=755172 RepID=UPI002AD2BB8E|nr:3-oxoacyl-ACP reductase family protein [Peptoniphilus coxii]